jgi:regulator of sirC expression with transglutaminase-like and TPR domain
MDAALAQLEFSQYVKQCDRLAHAPALDRACLLISAAFDPTADLDRCIAQLDDIAESAARLAGGATDSYAIAGGVCRAIFTDRGFQGNIGEYEDPRNSLLSSVLGRRMGIPITLSIVVMEVARRLGSPLDGVGLPGHFVVRFPDATSRLFIDAFAGGRILDIPECVRLVERKSRGQITWSDAFLEPVEPRAIVKRLLANLKNSLSQAQNYAAALTAIEMQFALDPDDPTELRDRGILFARLHRYDRAIADLEAYIERSPDAAGVKHIRDTILRYLREARNL